MNGRNEFRPCNFDGFFRSSATTSHRMLLRRDYEGKHSLAGIREAERNKWECVRAFTRYPTWCSPSKPAEYKKQRGAPVAVICLYETAVAECRE